MGEGEALELASALHKVKVLQDEVERRRLELSSVVEIAELRVERHNILERNVCLTMKMVRIP